MERTNACNWLDNCILVTHIIGKLEIFTFHKIPALFCSEQQMFRSSHSDYKMEAKGVIIIEMSHNSIRVEASISRTKLLEMW